MPSTAVPLWAALGLSLLAGCHTARPPASPVARGLHPRDLVDPAAQAEADDLDPPDRLAGIGERLRRERRPDGGGPPRTVLCLSGGGSYGAFTVGVLAGWTQRGDRPAFDVVTGVSTGALIAPFAFLGPRYDAFLTELYTTTGRRDLYRVRLGALLGESFADNRRMAAGVDAAISPAVVAAIAAAHRQGRRLYVGTTEQEGGRFVAWDLGAIAARGRPGDRELIVRILLGSASPPGVFPAARVGVTVDGVAHTERHVDGGVARALFFRSPFVPPAERAAAPDWAGTRVYAIVAGKLYADPQVMRPSLWGHAGGKVSTIVYAQTRRNLQELYLTCLLTGMDYSAAAVPPDHRVAMSSLEFDPAEMRGLFEAGRRVATSAEPWRVLPPGAGSGEGPLVRAGTDLTHAVRGPAVPILGPRGLSPPRPAASGPPAAPVK